MERSVHRVAQVLCRSFRRSTEEILRALGARSLRVPLPGILSSLATGRVSGGPAWHGARTLLRDALACGRPARDVRGTFRTGERSGQRWARRLEVGRLRLAWMGRNRLPCRRGSTPQGRHSGKRKVGSGIPLLCSNPEGLLDHHGHSSAVAGRLGQHVRRLRLYLVGRLTHRERTARELEHG